ncbi:hypothetical protein [Cytobacillus sp. FSL K6-0265]|uniref:hypothetical protein n=1 Tax=Cytobacillus sp. FSL K6-0265 TaxID=2921448 RepID=UPI0030FBB03F
MDIPLGDGKAIVLPPIPYTIAIIIIIFLLVRWAKKLETKKIRILFYFLISTYVLPVYTSSSEEGYFQLFIPIGFIFILLHLKTSKKYHHSKLKASILGFSLAVYQIVLPYI